MGLKTPDKSSSILDECDYNPYCKSRQPDCKKFPFGGRVHNRSRDVPDDPLGHIAEHSIIPLGLTILILLVLQIIMLYK